MNILFDTPKQAEQAMGLAIGRLFSLGARNEQDGDIKAYEDAKYVILCAAEYLGVSVKNTDISYSRDYYKIHQD